MLLYAAFLAGFTPRGIGLNRILNDYVYNGVLAMAGLTCLLRAALFPRQRGAWIAFGIGLLIWTAGDVYWTIAFAGVAKVPYPSWADVGYLAALPCFYAGIALLIKERLGRFTLASWLDGAVGALASAALGTAILAPALVGLTKGDTAAVLTNLAYPFGDVLLIAFLVGALIVSGLRGATTMLLICAGFLVWGGSDAIYLYQEATSSYHPGWLDQGWLVGAALIGAAACVSALERPRRTEGYGPQVAFPIVAAAAAVGVLTWDHFERIHATSLWLSVATLVAVLVRLALSFRENKRLMSTLRTHAVRDPLTGLANRRQLFEDLNWELAEGSEKTTRSVFALFDLDGFKSYNDSFGHPAGDALLRRLGANLDATVDGRGTAYRLGGDEFCIIVPLNGRKPGSIVEAGRAALTEAGEGFAIAASAGSVLLGDDAGTPSDALIMADGRMYTEKGRRSRRAEQQTRELLLEMVRATEPELSDHQHGVARMAVEMGRKLGLEAEELDVLGRAAELHDIGKIAIPDEILHKPGPLDEIEWELMRQHTLIGERILSVVAAMRPVARITRSSHERWDGAGYPDGLAGEEIPLGSRVILVCDAFEAMTAARPYHEPRSAPEAIAELRRNAGSQFDPDLVDLFCALFETDREISGPAPALR